MQELPADSAGASAFVARTGALLSRRILVRSARRRGIATGRGLPTICFTGSRELCDARSPRVWRKGAVGGCGMRRRPAVAHVARAWPAGVGTGDIASGGDVGVET